MEAQLRFEKQRAEERKREEEAQLRREKQHAEERKAAEEQLKFLFQKCQVIYDRGISKSYTIEVFCISRFLSK